MVQIGAEDSQSRPGTRTSVPDTDLMALRRALLRKEIALADLDLRMRARKYRLELRVQAAKLGYYRRKTALLRGAAPGTDS
ncbi:uncharacterized protein LOC134532053 isoform X2 [Bacillus rossius redtenbacheri]|uniref:uncharacterized protein LOC134532053 isoform X2 n=1 Tax=Bacillus rossius redtenbacheri TaxID=93214 RepID=UPI002FDD595E